MADHAVFSYDETANSCVVRHVPSASPCGWRTIAATRAEAEREARAHRITEHLAERAAKDRQTMILAAVERVLDECKAWGQRDPDLGWLYSKPGAVRVRVNASPPVCADTACSERVQHPGWRCTAHKPAPAPRGPRAPSATRSASTTAAWAAKGNPRTHVRSILADGTPRSVLELQGSSPYDKRQIRNTLTKLQIAGEVVAVAPAPRTPGVTGRGPMLYRAVSA